MEIYRSAGIADYVAAVRHSAVRIIGVALLLAGMVGLVASLVGSGDETFQSSADVLIQPPGDSNEVSTATQAQVLLSRPVAERVADGLDEDISVSSLLDTTIVTPVPESNILTITAEAGDPHVAARTANLFLREYLEVGAENTRSDLRIQLESQRREIAFTQRRLARARHQQDPSRVQINLLVTEVERQKADANATQQRLQRDLHPGRILAPATPAEAPVAQAISPTLLITSAGIAAALLALAFVLLKEHFSDRVRSTSDVVRLLRAPVLALLTESADPQDEALRLLAIDLHHDLQRREMRALMFIRLPGGLETEGLLARVAAHLRDSDRKVTVVLVDGHTRMIGSTNASDVTVPTTQTASPLTPPGAEKLLAELKAEWDTILIDGPVATTPDAFSLGASADGIVLIVKVDDVSQTQLARIREHLARTDTPLVGAVLLQDVKGLHLREN